MVNSIESDADKDCQSEIEKIEEEHVSEKYFTIHNFNPGKGIHNF